MKDLALFAIYLTRLSSCGCNLGTEIQRWFWMMLLELKPGLVGIEKLLGEKKSNFLSVMFRGSVGHAHRGTAFRKSIHVRWA